MPKKLVLIIILLGLTLAWTACGSNQDSDQTPEDTVQAPQLTVPQAINVFWPDNKGEKAYEITSAESINNLWQTIAYEQWVSNDEGIADVELETIVIDYSLPVATKIIIRADDTVSYRDAEGSQEVFYDAPHGTYKKTLKALAKIEQDLEKSSEISLNQNNITDIITEILDDSTLAGNDGYTPDIDCTVNDSQAQLKTILLARPWEEIDGAELPQNGGDIAVLSTLSDSTIIVEEQEGISYITVSYHGQLYSYYKTEGDLLTPILELLNLLK